MRTIIVHYHIFKNAGCSIDRILEMSFGDRWARLEGATATSILRSRDLVRFIDSRPTVVAVSSHLLRPSASAGLNMLPVVLIRHPLDRAFSVYSQMCRNAGDLPSEVVARRANFSQFVLWCLNNKSLGGMVIANYQVIHLSPASLRNRHIYNAVAAEGDLRYATDFLATGSCFGTVDKFDVALTRLRRRAEYVGLPLFATATPIENVTTGRSLDLSERVADAERQLGRGLCNRYRQENELDYRLYEWACCYQDNVEPRAS